MNTQEYVWACSTPGRASRQYRSSRAERFNSLPLGTTVCLEWAKGENGIAVSLAGRSEYLQSGYIYGDPRSAAVQSLTHSHRSSCSLSVPLSFLVRRLLTPASMSAPTDDSSSSNLVAIRDWSGHVGHLSPEQLKAFTAFKDILIKANLYRPHHSDARPAHDDSTLLYVRHSTSRHILP